MAGATCIASGVRRGPSTGSPSFIPLYPIHRGLHGVSMFELVRQWLQEHLIAQFVLHVLYVLSGMGVIRVFWRRK